MEQYVTTYKKLLNQYLHKQEEAPLYEVEQMSKSLIKHRYYPADIIHLHIQAMQEIFPNLDEHDKASIYFLLEAMSYYGIAYNEVKTLRDAQASLKSEIALAASVQETLLSTSIP